MAQNKFSIRSLRRVRWKTIAAWSLQILLALFFLAAAAAKLMGDEEMVAEFARIGIGQWFRYLTGILEIAGALLLLLPRTAFWGGILLAAMMATCAALHLFSMGGNPFPASVLTILSWTISWLRRPHPNF